MNINKVMIVDDDEDIRLVARMSLEDVGGWEVVEAPSGDEAIGLAAREQPDVVLLDVMMPQMDGPATLERLRGQPSTAHLPVVFLTAKTLPSEVERLTSLGAAGVLAKPFDPMTLADEVRAVLEDRNEPAPVSG